MSVGRYDFWPNKVVSGPGALKSLGNEIKAMGKKKVLVFTDQGMKELQLITDIVDMLKNDGLLVSFYGEIGPNPSDEMVHDAVEFMKKEEPEVIVCVGGGSPIDAAKAANVVYTHGGLANEYDVAIGGIEKITNKLLPMIAIPTTSGTGSEVSFVSVITDTKKKQKFGVISPLLIPDISLLDPEVTVSLPPKLTAYTGIDALTHLIESYVSVADFGPMDALSLHGIKMINRSLRKAVQDGKDIEAREEMIVASMMGGLAFSNCGLGLCHAMAHQLSSIFDTHHGLANAILLPHVMRFNLTARPKRFADIAEAMGADIRSLTVEEAAEKSIELVERLYEDLGIPRYLDEVGGAKDQIPALVERALSDPVKDTNPKPASAEDVKKIYLQAFKK